MITDTLKFKSNQWIEAFQECDSLRLNHLVCDGLLYYYGIEMFNDTHPLCYAKISVDDLENVSKLKSLISDWMITANGTHTGVSDIPEVKSWFLFKPSNWNKI